MDLRRRRCRLAVAMRREGLNFRDIAAVLRMTPGKARSHVAAGERHERERRSQREAGPALRMGFILPIQWTQS